MPIVTYEMKMWIYFEWFKLISISTDITTYKTIICTYTVYVFYIYWAYNTAGTHLSCIDDDVHDLGFKLIKWYNFGPLTKDIFTEKPAVLSL